MAARKSGALVTRRLPAHGVPEFLRRRVLPARFEILAISKGPRQHAVDVERAVQMVDLVLQDACIPAAGAYCDRFGAFIEAVDTHGEGAWHNRREAGQAEAAFEEFHRRTGLRSNSGID